MLPLLVVDYSFDKFNDFILTTRDGYYGFTQVIQGGSNVMQQADQYSARSDDPPSDCG